MAAKYYVWGEGVWRELDVASGRVSGWRRRARFVFVRRGRLMVARRRPVLRALESLAAGRHSAAADGPRLPHRSKSESRKHKHEPPGLPAPPACGHQYCCIHNGCLSHGGQAPHAPAFTAAAPPAPPAPPARSEAATQCARDVATSTERVTLTVKQTNTLPPAPASSPPGVTVHPSSAESVPRARRPLPASSATDVSVLLGKPTSPAAAAAAREKKRSPAREKKRSPARTRAGTRALPLVISEQSSSSSSEEGVSLARKAHAAVKELVVSDADVAVLRGFVARTRPRALPRFDADDAYKRALFYAINPLVELERCSHLERMLAARAFAARLGLVPSPAPPSPTSAPRRRRPESRSYRERSGSSDTDKENKGKHSSPNKVRSEPLSAVKRSAAGTERAPPRAGVSERAPPRAGVTERSDNEKLVAAIKAPQTSGVASDAPKTMLRAAAALEPARPTRAPPATSAPAPASMKPAAASDDSGVAPSVVRHVISQRASRANAKEYSNMEDHAIVAWLSSGSRASLVGGNRVWRDLEEQFQRLTGRTRSWHSLRNRYLRYILPGLGALRLPPAEVSRLRAAAATGAIKRQNRPGAALPPPPPPPSPPLLRASRRPRLLSSEGEGDSDGPPVPKRRSLRSRPLDSSSKEDSAKKSPRKLSASKESSKEPAKASGRKEANSKPSTSKETSSKDSSSKESGKAAGRSPNYSELTRRFAARRRRGASSASAPSPSPPSSRPPSPRPRSRRLFNPNANV